MDEWEILVRLGVKVGYSSGGLIRISQRDRLGEDAIILIHPEDISQLVQYLEAARQEINATEDE